MLSDLVIHLSHILHVLYVIYRLCLSISADLNRTVITLLVIYIFGAITSMLRSWLFTLSGQRLVARLRGQLFISIIRQEIAFFDTNR